MANKTPKHQLADMLLGEEGPLEAWVRGRREAGRSWRQITFDLQSEAGIELTYETLRSWFPHLSARDAA